ncbi:MAG TPA: SPOR domain-containing protein [Bryobacteraceae bacterium]|nr:SPOR domain-containing protein [Bryobacteraceae bacterium]
MSSATMPRNEAAASEASEFELVLGNKQLLSVFFIVVVLLGVFFTMGYIVGRNSAPVDAGRRTETYDRANAPSAIPTARPQQQGPVVISDQQTTTTAAAEPPANQPAASTAQPETPTPTPAAAAPAAPKPIEIPAVSATQPQAGQTYLQVVSVAKPQADALAEVLAKRGFRAFVAPGPDSNTFRVLVGPANDIDHLGRMKTELEAVGMKPFVKKY